MTSFIAFPSFLFKCFDKHWPKNGGKEKIVTYTSWSQPILEGGQGGNSGRDYGEMLATSSFHKVCSVSFLYTRDHLLVAAPTVGWAHSHQSCIKMSTDCLQPRLEAAPQMKLFFTDYSSLGQIGKRPCRQW